MRLRSSDLDDREASISEDTIAAWKQIVEQEIDAPAGAWRVVAETSMSTVAGVGVERRFAGCFRETAW